MNRILVKHFSLIQHLDSSFPKRADFGCLRFHYTPKTYSKDKYFVLSVCTPLAPCHPRLCPSNALRPSSLRHVVFSSRAADNHRKPTRDAPSLKVHVSRSTTSKFAQATPALLVSRSIVSSEAASVLRSCDAVLSNRKRTRRRMKADEDKGRRTRTNGDERRRTTTDL